MSEDKASQQHPLRQLRNLFITGLLVVVPVGVTFWIVSSLFNLIDRGIRTLLQEPFSNLCKLLFDKDVKIPPYGIGFVLTILLILMAGIVARNFIGRKLISLMERLMLRVPIINRIYKAVKQISESLLYREKNLFQGAVLIEYPRRGMYSIGFLTNTDCPTLFEKTDPDSVCIFIATTPNPTSGYVVILPRSEVIPLNITVEDAMKFVISAGVVVPERLPFDTTFVQEMKATEKPTTLIPPREETEVEAEGIEKKS